MPDSRASRSGLLLAFGAYGLWGFLPAYFLLLTPSGPIEIVAWRVTLSLLFCALLLVLTRAVGAFVPLLRDRRIMLLSAGAGILIAVNWIVYVYGSTNGFVVEASLGYFINPIVTVALGVLVLRERLRPAQWVAVGISLLAVLVLAVGYGQPPFIALTLALSFGFYGLLKNRMGPRVSAVASLTLETAWLTPIAIVVLVVLGATTGITMGAEGTAHAVLLSLAGIVTAVPLLLFGAAARRLPLSVLGLVQYVAPILQFAFGVVVMREPMPPERWLGFALVWVALVVLTTDALRHRRRTAALAVEGSTGG